MPDEREEALVEYLDEARVRLRGLSPAVIGSRTGSQYDESSEEFHFRVLAWDFSMKYPDFLVRAAAPPHAEGSPWLQALVVHYFAKADGTPVRNEWISLRETPDGLLYDQAFQGYAGDRLAAAIGNQAPQLAAAAKALMGNPESIGDLGFSFLALPRVPVAVAYWLGDEEFPPLAKVFFDASAPHYLPTFALATLGGRICSLLAKGTGIIQ